MNRIREEVITVTAAARAEISNGIMHEKMLCQSRNSDRHSRIMFGFYGWEINETRDRT